MKKCERLFLAGNGCTLKVHQEKKIEYTLKKKTLMNILKRDMYMDSNVNRMRLNVNQSKSPKLKLSDRQNNWFNLSKQKGLANRQPFVR